MAAAERVAPTGNAIVDTLLYGTKWTSATLTCGFPTATSEWSAYGPGGEPFSGFVPLTAAQQAAVTAALASWAAVAKLDFVSITEPDGVATLRFAGTGRTATAHAYLPSTSEAGGDVWFGECTTGVATWTPGSYEHLTAVHEIGHALGLKHPHQASAVGGIADPAVDSLEFTVMSYRSYVGASPEAGLLAAPGSYPAGPMVNDVAAIQALYGPNWDTAAGDTVYRYAPDGGVIFETVWDGGGTDTYDLSAYSCNLTVCLEPGGWSMFSPGQLATLDVWTGLRARGNVVNAHLYRDDPRALIENAIGGGGHDRLQGNAAANRLDGNAGADTLSGGEGDDSLYGNSGADVLVGGVAQDALFGGQGDDVLYGEPAADQLYGQHGADALYGGQGDDVLYGGPAADQLCGQRGADTLYGGQGDDLLFGGDGDDRLDGNRGGDVMAGGAGADLFVCGGDDTVSDFHAGDGDRIAPPAAVRDVADAAGSAQVGFADGSAVTLLGIAPAAVADGWFVAA
ncbi:M10 family metallopeptidase [Azospirillum sp. A39]|uniref:M10 family metallopeptidase n=1 Tax=Azospirillum sp. A39 TaxID=3462279 RepID=UPI00404668DE